MAGKKLVGQLQQQQQHLENTLTAAAASRGEATNECGSSRSTVEVVVVVVGSRMEVDTYSGTCTYVGTYRSNGME